MTEVSHGEEMYISMQTKEFTVEFPELWRQVGDSLVSVHSRIDARFDAIETRLDRMELANERRFDRIDARLEVLVAHIMRDETTSP